MNDVHCEGQLRTATPAELADSWRDLANGSVRISAVYSTRTRHFVELTLVRDSKQASARDTCVLDRIFSGDAPKVIAMDTEQSPSTVSGKLRRSLESLGLNCSGRQIPIILLAMYEQWVARRGLDGTNLPSDCVLSIIRPDIYLKGVLSDAEHAVLQSLVDGEPYSKIAASRGTSQRTVANQAASVYRKLAVSGRTALMNRLVTRAVRSLPEQKMGA
ncbi:MAG TPA: LuxR C-terminal-related transcriptional regulator [Polyangiaceae bacterium]|nr:LuxR C-terminal-related transcriptional regulator [Polyangiaceae bacterium]